MRVSLVAFDATGRSIRVVEKKLEINQRELRQELLMTKSTLETAQQDVVQNKNISQAAEESFNELTKAFDLYRTRLMTNRVTLVKRYSLVIYPQYTAYCSSCV